MRAIKILLISSLLFSANLLAQEAETAPAPTNLDKLLELVKEGRTQEQSENDKREAEFKASRDKQNEILKAEQRELARQERIADQLEEEFRKNQEKLRVAEEAYLKQLGSLNELFGHMQSIVPIQELLLSHLLLLLSLVKIGKTSLKTSLKKWVSLLSFQL